MMCSSVDLFFLLNISALTFAFFLDLIFGELPIKFHPIVYIGKLISFLERLLYNRFSNRSISGILTVVIAVAIVVIPIYFLSSFLWQKNKTFYFLFSAFIFFNAISIKCLKDHVMRIKEFLDQKNYERAKFELSMIVTRDTKEMGPEEIIKSTVESIAENFVDSVFAPIFYSLFGPASAFFFKTISTLDSMIGYKTKRYIEFGKFAAKMDDILCFIPARLCIVPISIASHALFGKAKDTVISFLKYRKAHSSPNSAHSISAFAGALDLTFGGRVIYFGQEVYKPLIGDRNREIKSFLISEAFYLYLLSSIISLLIFDLIFFLMAYI